MPTASSSHPPDTGTLPGNQSSSIHWSMRFMSLLSLGVLGVYTVVIALCRRQRRQPSTTEQARLRLSLIAFSLDFAISFYFTAATPLILKKAGVAFDRKNMPRPLFWFFAITGFVPTFSMLLTVFGGWKWRERIRHSAGWRNFHVVTGIVAYVSWWIACSPLFVMGLLGEQRTIELIKRYFKSSPEKE